MSNQMDDLDLLLSLQDRVPESPPASPDTRSSGYLSDDGLRREVGAVDMSVFRNVVEDCLNCVEETAYEPMKPQKFKGSNCYEVEKFSGLRIRNKLVSSLEMTNYLADIRFVRLPVIRNVLVGDILTGCWATIGVLIEKGRPKTSSTGKSYGIWKMGCLDEKTVSIFLFGDAYQKNCKEEAGTVFALFNCNIRKDTSENGYCLSVYSAGNVLKIGSSADYGVCKGKRKDGMACTVVINKSRGVYCGYHRLQTSEKYSISRTELRGGNLKTAFRDLKSEGIHLVKPLSDMTNVTKSKQPVKLLSVEGLKRALSNADKVTTNGHSQGIRFLTEMTGSKEPQTMKRKLQMPNQELKKSRARSSTPGKNPSEVKTSNQLNSKILKAERQCSSERNNSVKEKLIELEIVSSDEDI